MKLNIFGLSTFFRGQFFRKLSALILLLVCFTNEASTQDMVSKAENLWSKTDLNTIQQTISDELNLSKEDSALFFGTYIKSKIIDIRSEFYNAYLDGKINELFPKQQETFLANIYKREFAVFTKIKRDFAKAISLNAPNLRQEAVNAPCTNMDFTQNFTAWTGAYRNRNLSNDNDNPNPGPFINGFSEHCVMTPAMTDPYIPAISVVPPLPAPQRAVRLGNVVNGGQLATISQTFLVTQSNTILTYRYAVVLEDPKGADNHEGLDAPHFSAILTTSNGDTLRCAKYSVTVKDTGIVDGGFVLGCNTSNSQQNNNNFRNWGCPASATASGGYDGIGLLTNAVRITAPISGACGGNSRSFYYKTWTTISIPLTKYVGQNMTMSFTASDCMPGGHLGYAYVQAECSPITISDPGYICSGKQTKVLKAPPGFLSYHWNGPGIVGSSTGSTVTINKSGRYQIVLVPFSDDPCPDTAYVFVREHCAPPAISKTYCEDVANMGKVANVNLASFETEIKGTYTNSTIVSWHRALPATTTNKLATLSGQVITNGMSFYAIIKHPMPVGDSIPVPLDTVALSFVVNKKPVITFPAIPNTCVNSPSFSITGVNPSGGVFFGSNVSSTGVFSPVAVGSFPIKYKVTNALGCTDSLSKNAVVINLPSIQAFGDTIICYKNSAISLPIKATMVGDSINWTSTFGTIGNKAATSTNVSVSGTAPLEVTITLVATAIVKGCPSASDTIKIVTHQMPAIVLSKPDSACKNNPELSVNATISNVAGVAWMGKGGKFAPDSLSTNIRYMPNAAEILAQKVWLKAVTLPKLAQYCPMVSDSLEIPIYNAPTILAPLDTVLCEPTKAVELALSAQSSFSDSVVWRSSIGLPSPQKGLNTSINISTDTPFRVFVTAYKKGCFPVNDSSDVTFEALPVVSATATPTCFADHRVILAGVSTKSGLKNSATWTSDGSGIFAPHPDSISNVYTPSATDISGKTNKLTITSKGQKYCPASDTTIVWNYVPFPLADVGKDDTVCVNTTISRTTVSDPDWKYEWKSSALAGIVSSNSTISSLISKDTTTLFVTVKNSRNCEAKDSVMILGITPPTLSLSPKICFYAPVSITASVAKPPALGKYTWKLADSVLIETSATLMLNQTGKYTYDYVFKTCSASAKMEAFAPPKLLVKDTSSCKNVLAQIEANPIAGALYFWNNSAVGVPGNTFNINAGNGISGAKVLVIDANTCRDSSTFNVKIYPYPDFTLKGVDICPNEKGELQAALLDSSLLATHIPTATWFRNGIKIPSASGQKLTYNVPGIYKLEIAVRGCISIHSETIENKPSPKINIPLRYKLCFETDPDLVLKSNPFAKYKWLSEEGDLIDTTQTIAVKPDKDTHYQLFVTNEFSCKDSVKMLVRKVCPPRLFVPNVITPESADVNSALRIFGAHYTNFEITIFSRWGEVIFNTKDDKNAWDGMYINENMPIGNYQWQVTYEGDSEEYKGPYKKTGDVAVVR